MTGNELWHLQVQQQLNKKENQGMHYKQAEIEVFRILYDRMRNDNMKVIEIEAHFLDTFDIKHAAFYRRLKKAGEGRVLL